MVFSVAPVQNATSYNWSFPAGATIVSGAGTNTVSVDFSLTAVSGNVSVAGVNNIGTGPSSTVLFITVIQVPDAYAGDDRTICLGETTILGRSSSVTGNTYFWSSNTGTSVTNVHNPTVEPVVTTIFTLVETHPSGATSTNQVTVTVNPLPQAKVINDVTVCSDDNIEIGAPPVAGSSYQWYSVPAGYSSTSSNPTLDPTDLSFGTRTYYLIETNN